MPPAKKADVKKKSNITDAIASIRVDIDEAKTGLDDIEALSTGSLAVDMVTGIGGFPRRRMAEVAGLEQSGKTTLCLRAATQAQRGGHFVAYLDPEHGLDKTHAERIGFDWRDESRGVYFCPDSLEDTFRIVERLVETDAVRLVIVDSIPGLVPQKDLDGDIAEVGAIGQKARLMSAFIPRMAKVIAKHDVALVFVNQLRNKIETGWRPPGAPSPKPESTGGMALKFFFALRLHTTLVKKGHVTKTVSHPLTGKDEEVAVANLHRVEAVKNKLSAPYREAEYYIRYDTTGPYGIDNYTTVVYLAIAKGIITKKGGGHYTYTGPNNFSVRSEEDLYAHVFEHRAVLLELCEALDINPETL